jgi:hypothetical protein
MTEKDWATLLARIGRGKCTPFLGAGACADSLLTGTEIARKWAREHDYPLEDADDLARVAQFIGVDRGDAMFPKELIVDEFNEGSRPPDFERDDEPHAVLARLPFRVYMTTNYDDFMISALRRYHKDPRRELCRWNTSPAMRAEPTVLGPAFEPTVASPVVFYLHGYLGVPESLVLTEDDYLDFLVAVSRDPDLLPHQIQRALAGTSLLFIGYRLADWDFRVLHRGLVMAGEPSLRRLSLTVQLPGEASQRRYLESYFDTMHVRVYWGTAAEFVAELRERWEQYERVG